MVRVIPGILVMALIFLPLYDKNPYRHYSKRKFAIGLMSFIVIGMVGLTIKDGKGGGIVCDNSAPLV